MLRAQENKKRALISLSGIWEIKKDKSTEEEDIRPIAVPGSWNEQYQDFLYEEGKMRYKKTFHLSKDFEEKAIRLYFEAVNTRSEIYLNGEKVGENEVGYLPFEIDITDKVKFEEENILEVLVENELRTDSFPAGNTPQEDLLVGTADRRPSTNFDFLNYGGIIRPVTIEITNKEKITDIMVDTSLSSSKEKRGIINFEILTNANNNGTIEVVIAGEKHQKDIENGKADVKVELENAKFWNLENPYLYDVEINLKRKDQTLDSYKMKIGIRKIRWDSKNLYLNDEPLKLKGFGKHEEFPVLGQGTFYPLIVKDYNLLKWIGANSFRTSHYPYTEDWLDLADQLGILVIDEAPHVGITRYHYNDETTKLCVKSIKRMIDRDKNHPSVIMWSVANEPESTHPKSEEFFKQLYETAKKSDKTRPVTFVSCMDMPGREDVSLKYFDIICINRYFGWYVFQGRLDEAISALNENLEYVYKKYNKPILLTEFGADAIPGYHYDPPILFSEEYQKELIKRYIEVIDSKDYTIGEHIWAFADFKTQEEVRRPIYNHKGVFTRDRQPKIVAHYLRDIWK
ncbi:beta-glucuronidase [Petrotoga miotherma DSM 10691]|uniref:Beta-glucuronidase n=2 Tax=Petrotoga TaxID=28236 RepID=A0A2K1PBJ4_9BACT|nr:MULTISPECIES: beta-glucuronidase [Petrotoga]PNS00057.1 beta-glucuronidase [Petrotoga miotherma DSM 10691]POZ92766.1 beta-glucuronidase [Petrotoga halophila DSM 16923]